jgi:ABC-type phosphate/phosphonate transport system substrate-binding protein
MTVSFPMYLPAQPQAVQHWWQALREQLLADPAMAHTELPEQIVWPLDYPGHWRTPDLLLSQTCGYPLTHALRGQLQLVGTLVYDAPGVAGMYSRSHLITRRDDPRASLESFRGSRLAFNADDSQSGYHALRALIAPQAREGRFFGQRLETGAHVRSIAAVARGEADVAAIDAVTWALAQDATPAWTEQLTTLTLTEAYPGLPLVTARSTAPDVLAALQRALHHSSADPRTREIRQPLRITGFVASTLADYEACVAMEAQASAQGMGAL